MRILIALLFLCVGALPVSAQDEGGGEAATDTKPPAPLADVRVETTTFNSEPEVPTSFVVPIRLINNSSYSITLESFSARFLIPPGAFRTTPATHDVGATQASGMASCPFNQISISPGSSEYVFCTFLPEVELSHGFSLLALMTHWRTLTFSPGDYQIYVVAGFQGEYSDDSTFQYNASSVFSVRMRPSVWQVVIGAGLGALLLAIFIVNGRDGRPRRPRPLTRMRIRAWGAPILKLWISGWVTACILIFLTYRMQDSGFPISLSINDFYGGIVVGLFSYIGAHWLKTRILTTDDAQRPAHEPSPPQDEVPSDPPEPPEPPPPVTPDEEVRRAEESRARETSHGT